MGFAHPTQGRLFAFQFSNWFKQEYPQPYDEFSKSKAWDPVVSHFAKGKFTVADMVAVTALSAGERQVYEFVIGINESKNQEVTQTFTQLAGWGGWQSIIDLLKKNQAPFTFAPADLERVLDPRNQVKTRSPGEINVLYFMQGVNSNQKIKTLMDKVIRWGGWDYMLDFAKKNKVPFSFTAQDLQRELDPTGKYGSSSVGEINVHLFLEAVSTEAELKKYIDECITHGYWQEILDFVKKNKAPYSFTMAELRKVCDPNNRYGIHTRPAPTPPPEPIPVITPVMEGGVAAYEWTKGAGESVGDWCKGAGNSVADWTTGAAGDVASWTSSAASSSFNWTKGAAGSVGDWATGAAGDVSNWTTGAANSTANWTTGAAKDVGSWTSGAANDAASWTKGAASSATNWTSGAAKTVGKSVSKAFNPSKW